MKDILKDFLDDPEIRFIIATTLGLFLLAIATAIVILAVALAKGMMP